LEDNKEIDLDKYIEELQQCYKEISPIIKKRTGKRSKKVQRNGRTNKEGLKVKMGKASYDKDVVSGSRTILRFKQEENSKQYHLIISVFLPSQLLCLEWFDGVNSRFLGCDNLNLLVTYPEIEKWFLEALSKSLETDLTNSIKEVIDNRDFDGNLEAILESLNKHGLELEFLSSKEKQDKP